MVKVRHERALMGEKPHCPDCERVALRRQGRVGFLQRVVYPRLGLFPWECGLCRKIFMLGQRSTGYRQHATEDEIHPEPAPGVTSGSIPGPALDSSRDSHPKSHPAAVSEFESEFTRTARRELLPAHGLSSKVIKTNLAQGNIAPTTLARANRPNKIAG